MKRYFLRAIGTMACLGMLYSFSYAQENKLEENEVIIIKKKGDKKSKVTVEVNDGEVRVNGKPLSSFKDDNLEIQIERSGPRVYGVTTPRSPFRRGGTTIYGADRPLLGVITDNDNDNGAKVTAVTKGSAAEKAGVKVGDVITKINDEEIETPRELTETVGKMKPEDKVSITVRRNNKDEKLTATLGKRSGDVVFNSPDVLFDSPDLKYDLNLDFDNNFRSNGAFGMTTNRGRLGIKAQDTEDGKGVKVLDVDDESNAEKAGIEDGDIIMEFDGKAVNSATELADAAKDAREKNAIKVKLNRDGKNQELEIKIPKKLKTANL